jgi:hypothetical protein
LFVIVFFVFPSFTRLLLHWCILHNKQRHDESTYIIWWLMCAMLYFALWGDRAHEKHENTQSDHFLSYHRFVGHQAILCGIFTFSSGASQRKWSILQSSHFVIISCFSLAPYEAKAQKNGSLLYFRDFFVWCTAGRNAIWQSGSGFLWNNWTNYRHNYIKLRHVNQLIQNVS